MRKTKWTGDDAVVIIKGIEMGDADDHLRDITLACIERHRQMTGVELVTRYKRSPQPVQPTAQPVAQPGVFVVRRWESPAVSNFQMLTEKSIAYVPNTGTKDVFKMGLRFYPRRQVLNKAIRILPVCGYSNGEYDNLRVLITGLGPKMLKIDFIDPPPPGSSARKKMDGGNVIFAPYALLDPYLIR